MGSSGVLDKKMTQDLRHGPSSYYSNSNSPASQPRNDISK